MTVQIGVPLPVMCEPNGSMVIQSIMSNVAFCAEAKLHNKVSKAETWLNFRRSNFFTRTSAKAIGLLNVERLVWGEILTETDAGEAWPDIVGGFSSDRSTKRLCA